MRKVYTTSIVMFLGWVLNLSLDITSVYAEKPQPLRIGVFIRTGFEDCIAVWSPTADYLSQAIPGREVAIVPLASREDIYQHLQKGQIDFLVANAAVYVCAEERFGASVLATMVNRSDPSRPYSAGCIIRKSERNDLAQVADLSAARFAAVKPWSFSGWIMQWQTLLQHRINPRTGLAVVEFEATHQDAIQSVLNETADAGAVDLFILKQQVELGAVDPKKLFVFDVKGNAVPLEKGIVASTETYPNLVLSMAAKTDMQMALKVVGALMSIPSDSKEGLPTWTVPENYQAVRNCLKELMGTDYAYSTDPIPQPRLGETKVFAVLGTFAAMACVILLAVWLRARYRENLIRQEIQTVNAELNEARASRHFIETILTQVDCGMDVVNEDNEVVYVTPGVEERFGPCRGKKCHEYYWGSDKPCKHCLKRLSSESRDESSPYTESCRVTFQRDRHALGKQTEDGEDAKLLQVPFYDENGQWLYARVHLPPEEFMTSKDIENLVANIS